MCLIYFFYNASESTAPASPAIAGGPRGRGTTRGGVQLGGLSRGSRESVQLGGPARGSGVKKHSAPLTRGGVQLGGPARGPRAVASSWAASPAIAGAHGD